MRVRLTRMEHLMISKSKGRLLALSTNIRPGSTGTNNLAYMSEAHLMKRKVL
jgi:hypothetical protein